jgi:riboflavin kinase / FMN adenylyltransferase
MARVYRSLAEIGPEARPSAVCIGNFDGVHAAHRRLFDRCLKIARELNLISSALTFDPHPASVVAPERAPKLLTPIEERLRLIAEAGLQQIFVLRFDRAFSERTPEGFVEDILVNTVGARAVIVGDNFRFGHGHAGNVDTLRSLGQRYGFVVEVVPGVKVRGRMVSSTEVRNLIASGDVSKAGRLLLRPYALEGRVVSGFGIGSKQTVPTLNLETAAEVLPARGVYITRTRDLDDDRTWPSITNVGTRPTFNGEHQTIETFLLAPLEGKRPERIRVELLRRVRDEKRFESPEVLKAQILRDAARASAYHRRTARLPKSLVLP